jgi:hypothetical protein
MIPRCLALVSFVLAMLGPSLVLAAREIGPQEPIVHRFALVIGSNFAQGEGQSPLRFADDDAARMTELLEEIGVDVELVASLDRDTQATFPELVARAHPADRAGLDAGWASLLSRLSTAESAGETTELLVYYSGHGDVGPDGQGYLTLDGARITRHDLFAVMLHASPADHDHVLIDACRSEQFVVSRGRGEWKDDRTDGDFGKKVAEALEKTDLKAFPNLGIIVAHSADQQTHEWDRYRGGVFSHQLVSGLRGGADLNGDGRIEYSELAAFVSAANHGVSDPRARLDVTVRPPPDDERHPVLAHDDLGEGRVLLLPAGDASRWVLEDGRGVRLADVKRSGEQPAWVRLPKGDVFVHREGEERTEARVPAGASGVIHAGGLEFQPESQAPRGALDQALRAGLFSTPFGPGYYAGYTARTGLLGVADASWQGDAWASAPEPTKVAAEPAPVQAEATPKPVQKKTPDTSRWWHGPRWGGVFFGTVVTPFNPRGIIDGQPTRVTSNQFQGCLGAREGVGCSALRGFDLRWQYFNVGRNSKYPRALFYFRTGYQSGFARFNGGMPETLQSGFPSSLAYFTVPLFLGGNIYLFDAFPVRPYAGLGFGLDVIRLDYDRPGEPLSDVVARPGFELHAGIEARITNWVSLTGEVQQLWSARKKYRSAPDFSNEGFTIITGVAIGFPLSRPDVDAMKRRR